MSDTQIHDTDVSDQDDGPVITKLRQELREAQKEAKANLDKANEAETKLTKQLESEVRALVDKAGYPKLDIGIVMDRIEGEATDDSVAKALEAAGLSPQSAEGDGKPEENQAPPIGGASDLGQRVAAAASGGPVKALDDRIAEATTAEELAAIMDEAGLTADHSG